MSGESSNRKRYKTFHINPTQIEHVHLPTIKYPSTCTCILLTNTQRTAQKGRERKKEREREREGEGGREGEREREREKEREREREGERGRERERERERDVSYSQILRGQLKEVVHEHVLGHVSLSQIDYLRWLSYDSASLQTMNQIARNPV